MIAPSWICAGATSGTYRPDPGTFTRTSPATGSTLMLWPATGRGRVRGPAGALTCTSLVPAEELPAASVAVALAVKGPARGNACVSEAPSPLVPSPKSQWIDGGPLQTSVAVASSCAAPPVRSALGFATIGDSTGGTGSKTAVSTAVDPAAHAACT